MSETLDLITTANGARVVVTFDANDQLEMIRVRAGSVACRIGLFTSNGRLLQGKRFAPGEQGRYDVSASDKPWARRIGYQASDESIATLSLRFEERA